MAQFLLLALAATSAQQSVKKKENTKQDIHDKVPAGYKYPCTHNKNERERYKQYRGQQIVNVRYLPNTLRRADKRKRRGHNDFF